MGFGRLGAMALVLGIAGCASHPPAMPRNVTIGSAAALPSPLVAPNDAPPQILAMRFSGNDVHRGQTWSGEISTSTNVASVEVRTNLFSINVPRTAFGRFAFALRVYDVPPIFIRAYRLRVIARNSKGVQAEEDLPFRLR